MNSASRILAIYDKALHFPAGNGAPFLRLWGNVFGISENANQTHEDEVIAGLAALRGEIGLARTHLLEKGCPPQLFDRYFNKVRELASPALLHQDCKGLRSEHKNDVRLALEWAAWVLPDEEAEMPAEEVASLAEELDSLALSLDQADLPPATRSFITRQIGLIRSALRLYGVQGIAAVETALEQSLGSSAMADSATIAQELEMASPEGKALLRRFGEVFGKVVHAADSADKLRKGVEAVGKLGPVLSALAKFLLPG